VTVSGAAHGILPRTTIQQLATVLRMTFRSLDVFKLHSSCASLPSAELSTTVDPLLIEACVCPACHGSLTWDAGLTTCVSCGRSYPVVDGIPVFAVLHGDDHKRGQAELRFDAPSANWEIERPSGGAALYGWLMLYKLRRGVSGIESHIRGATVLVVCAGSGMDAEFLARQGARVIASDVSLDAAMRTRERARRHRIPLIPLVADAEALPFRDHGIELTFVHDGLHHLRDPTVGVREMARVTADALSISEPAKALVTAIAIKAGIALVEEPAGNPVARLELPQVKKVLQDSGLDVVAAERYAMFYRHEPGPAMRLLSRGRLQPLARHAIRLFNTTFGPVSNKLVVKAVRRQDH